MLRLQFFKASVALALTSILSACFGGSDTTSDQVAADVVRQFSDGSGIARIAADGFTGTVIGPDIQSLARAEDELVAVDDRGLVYVTSDLYGDFFGGEVTINGLPIDVVAYSDFGGNVALIYAEDDFTNLMMALGPEARNLPRSGSATYSGTNIIGNRDGSYFELGTFAMNVDFASARAALSATTPHSSIGGTGISLNLGNATFAGTNLDMRLNGRSTSGSIFGDFHGDGGIGVTGIYTENGSNPVVAGAIAGTRQ